MSDVTVKPLSTHEVARWANRLAHLGHRDAPILVILFGGDRITCCDEALGAYDPEGRLMGVATLAPEGEMGEGPTIVGLYVLPQHRRKGVGTALLKAAAGRMVERGLVPVRVDVMGTAARRLVDGLPEEVRRHLVVNRHGPIMDLWSVQ